MKNKQRILLALLALLAAFVLWLALRNPQPPLLPEDAAHRVFRGTEACLECHGPEGPLPRSPNHPLGPQCLRCHGVP